MTLTWRSPGRQAPFHRSMQVKNELEQSTPARRTKTGGRADRPRLTRYWRRMSAYGTKQTSISTLNMSAFGGKADICDRLADVCY